MPEVSGLKPADGTLKRPRQTNLVVKVHAKAKVSSEYSELGHDQITYRYKYSS